MKTLKIRPHHLLCTKFFCGNGYNSEFTENISRISSEMKNEAFISITNECDDICKKCPNRVENECSDKIKPTEFDDMTVKLCGIEYGRTYTYSELSRIADENVIYSGRLKDICSQCEWFYICGNS